MNNTNLQQAITGYIKALLWANGSEEEQEFYGCDQVQPELSKVLDSHITRFINDNAGILDEYLDAYSYGQMGHDMYLTEARHGVGFWDRGMGSVGDKLTAYCDKFNLAEHYLEAVDGVIHVHPSYFKGVSA